MATSNNKHTTLAQLEMLATRTKTELDKLAQEIEDIEDGGLGVYSLKKQETAESGYLATYQLTKNDSPIGDKINIPKDFLVKSAEIKTVSDENQPYTGAQVGDKYIDFVINAKESEETESHVYLAVNELVKTHTSGNGIDISEQNVVSIKIDTTSANGLSVDGDGLKLALAVANSDGGSGGSAGAMSAADKTKLDGIETAEDSEVEEMLSEVFDED